MAMPDSGMQQRLFSTGYRLGANGIAASIGASGMGEVFRAHDPRRNRDGGIKVLPKDFVADANRLRRFKLEAKRLAVLNHPHVLTMDFRSRISFPARTPRTPGIRSARLIRKTPAGISPSRQFITAATCEQFFCIVVAEKLCF